MKSPQTVYVLIGAQGSGKSYWARANASRLSAVVVSSDVIRNILESTGLDAADEEDRVFAILEQRVTQELGRGRSVIVDATHARRAWRAPVVALARARGARRVAVWFDVRLAFSRAGNKRKTGSDWGNRPVDDSYLAHVWRGLEPPAQIEFDEIVRLTEQDLAVVPFDHG